MVKNLPANEGDVSLTSGLGTSPGEGNDNPLQYSCLGNSMDRGTWRATVRGVARVKQNLATKQQQKQPALYRKGNSYSLIAHMRLQPKYNAQFLLYLKAYML